MLHHLHYKKLKVPNFPWHAHQNLIDYTCIFIFSITADVFWSSNVKIIIYISVPLLLLKGKSGCLSLVFTIFRHLLLLLK